MLFAFLLSLLLLFGVVGVCVGLIAVGTYVCPDETEDVAGLAVELWLTSFKVLALVLDVVVSIVWLLLCILFQLLVGNRQLFDGNKPNTSETTVTVITGASSGIGRELALQYARRGDVVVVAARRQHRLEEVVAACRKEGAKSAFSLVYDASKESSGQDLINSVVEHYGKIDRLVLNAGIGGTFSTMEDFINEQRNGASDSDSHHWKGHVPLEQLERIMEVNFWGYVRATIAAIPELKKSPTRNPSIVVVSSMYGKIAAPFQPVYSGSKHALQGFFNTLRPELARSGISVSIHCPGGIETEVQSKLQSSSGDFVTLSLPDVFLAKAEHCARSIIHMADHGKPESMFPLYARLFSSIHSLWPHTFDNYFSDLVNFYFDVGLMDLQ
eukprot:m.127190 g.127190  ORF g.127190 m.127190 type:complete len:384 (+) comp13002_c0_seq1:1963-3114(+)